MEAKSGSLDVPGGHVLPPSSLEEEVRQRQWQGGDKNHEVSGRPPSPPAPVLHAPGNSPPPPTTNASPPPMPSLKMAALLLFYSQSIYIDFTSFWWVVLL